MRGFLTILAVRDMIKRMECYAVPIIEGGFKRKRKAADIKIDAGDTNGAQAHQAKINLQEQSGLKKEGILWMYKLFTRLNREKRYEYDVKVLAYLGIQKVVDATEQVKVKELEKEEALKNIEGHLEKYIRLF